MSSEKSNNQGSSIPDSNSPSQPEEPSESVTLSKSGGLTIFNSRKEKESVVIEDDWEQLATDDKNLSNNQGNEKTLKKVN